MSDFRMSDVCSHGGMNRREMSDLWFLDLWFSHGDTETRRKPKCAAGTICEIHTDRYESALSAQSAGDLCLIFGCLIYFLTEAQRHRGGLDINTGCGSASTVVASLLQGCDKVATAVANLPQGYNNVATTVACLNFHIFPIFLIFSFPPSVYQHIIPSAH